MPWPSAAKLSLGGLLLVLLPLVHRLTGPAAGRQIAACALAGGLAMVIALQVTAFHFYPAPGRLGFPPHALCGLLGGAIFAVSRQRCAQRWMPEVFRS